MLRAMHIRQHNSYALEANLHGYKVPLIHPIEPSSSFSEEEEIVLDPAQEERLLREAQARVRSRYGK